jgi:hypothetical protein
MEFVWLTFHLIFVNDQIMNKYWFVFSLLFGPWKCDGWQMRRSALHGRVVKKSLWNNFFVYALGQLGFYICMITIYALQFWTGLISKKNIQLGIVPCEGRDGKWVLKAAYKVQNFYFVCISALNSRIRTVWRAIYFLIIKLKLYTIFIFHA